LLVPSAQARSIGLLPIKIFAQQTAGGYLAPLETSAVTFEL